MKMISPKTAVATAVLLTALLPATLVSPSASAAEPSPWQTLDDLRTVLVEAGPSRAEFTQTYVPAGFASGERERGAMSLALPECLRWDYEEPYAKTFLLCGDEARYWNPEDNSGRRYSVDREEEPGLDLLMLSVDTLRQRYRATQKVEDDGRVRVTLEPLTDVGSLAEATLTVAAGGQRLSGLTYRDREGNLTRFSMAAPTPLDASPGQPDGVFAAPSGIRWQD